MGVIKNDVGRPSNKTIMIRRILKGVVILPIIALLAFAYYKVNGKKTVHTNTVSSKKLSKYVMENNSLSDFDLFLVSPQTKMYYSKFLEIGNKVDKLVVNIPPQAYIPVHIGIQKMAKLILENLE